MTRQVRELFFALIRSQVCGEPLSDGEKALCTEECLEELYELSSKQDLAHIVSAALVKNQMLSNESEIASKFKKKKMMSIYRYQGLGYEYETVCAAFDEAGFDYLPLKGAVIRKYYPEPWMRTSCDIDILVKNDDIERASSVLTDKLGYRREEMGNHDISFFSPSGFHMELHYDLVEDGIAGKSNKTLASVWEYSHPIKDGSHHMEMSDGMFYFYHIAHMAKHFERGGCGVRTLLDGWILTHKVEGDIPEREKLLTDGELYTFSKVVERLSDIWFSGAPYDEQALRIEEYIISGGTYGTVSNKVSVAQTKMGSKFKYAMSRIFLPYESLKFHYPVLQAHRWLMPVCQVRRWFKLLFKGGVKRSIRELQSNQKVTKEDNEDIAGLLKSMGL